MSLRECRLVSVFAAALAVMACGFTPALQSGSPGRELHGNFDVSVHGEREGHILETLLERRLQASESANLLLEAEIETETRRAAVAGAGGIDRMALDAVARYKIVDRSTMKVIQESSVEASVSYSRSDDAAAQSLASRRDAEDRAMQALADRIVAKLLMNPPERSS